MSNSGLQNRSPQPNEWHPSGYLFIYSLVYVLIQCWINNTPTKVSMSCILFPFFLCFSPQKTCLASDYSCCVTKWALHLNLSRNKYDTASVALQVYTVSWMNDASQPTRHPPRHRRRKYRGGNIRPLARNARPSLILLFADCKSNSSFLVSSDWEEAQVQSGKNKGL